MGWFGGKTHYFRKHPYTSPMGMVWAYLKKKTIFLPASRLALLKVPGLAGAGSHRAADAAGYTTAWQSGEEGSGRGEGSEGTSPPPEKVFFRGSSSLSLRILAHRTSDDERLGCFPSSPKRKVFRFHETILKRWARIPRVCWLKLSEDSVNSVWEVGLWWTSEPATLATNKTAV